MGDRLRAGKLSRYVISHPGQLSLAIPLCVGEMSTSLGWEGNRRSGVALAMRHRQQWFIHLRAQQRMEGRRAHRLCSFGVSPSFTFTFYPVYTLCLSVLMTTTMQPVDIKSRWRHNWKSAQVVNSHLVWPNNPATRFRLPSATMVSVEPFLHGKGTLRCLQKEMATYKHWSVSLWWDPDDVSHCRILSPDKTEWRLISAALCRWRRCFVADQLWLMSRIREEEEWLLM